VLPPKRRYGKHGTCRIPNVVATVYVVEDDGAVRDSLRVLLESEGLTIVAFASAEAFLSETQPDGAGCLLLDWHLPGMSGHELLEVLSRGKMEIAVVLMSGDPDPAMRRAAERTVRRCW